MEIEITSLQNPKIKNLISLQKARERRKTNTFTIEGVREISLAQQAGYQIPELFVCKSLYQQDPDYPISMNIPDKYFISQEIFSKVAYREGSGGLIAVAKIQKHTLEDLRISSNPLYLVLEQVEKPGNIGAMLRTADAGAIDGLIICDPACDLYNPNVIRSGLGCLFTVPIAICTNAELLGFFKQNHIRSYATLLTASKPYTKESFTGPSAFLLGAESTGLSVFWQKNADIKIKIPMMGKIDSLNVSNAAAIFMFEALRQRNL